MNPLRLSDPTDENSAKVAPSFSGNERNRMFLQRNSNFSDVSLVSGADFRQDGRGFAILDFDKDGFLDMAVTSPTKPRLRILRNTLGNNDLTKGNNFVKIQLVGGNRTSAKSNDLSATDACGAKVEVSFGGKTQIIQKNCGEGLSSQNSSWLHIGIGDAAKVNSIKVTWPSQKTTEKTDVEAGKWIRIEESGTT